MVYGVQRHLLGVIGAPWVENLGQDLKVVSGNILKVCFLYTMVGGLLYGMDEQPAGIAMFVSAAWSASFIPIISLMRAKNTAASWTATRPAQVVGVMLAQSVAV